MANITNYLILNELKANIVLNSKFYRIFGINGDKILLVNNSDEVFAYGDNSNGLLGLGHNNSIEKRTKLNDLCHKQVVDITYGKNHVLALTKSGDCYSWGSNSFGQLGNGTKNDSNKPNLIHESFNGSIIQISCGSNYSFVLTNSRQVYAFGDNSFGQLGTGNHENQLIPIKVFSEEVIMISCGYWHSLVLTANGRAFGSGNNNNGELGLSNNENQNTFKSIMGFVNIKKISCGQNHSLLLTNDGKVYGFGLNNFGQILRSNEKNKIHR
jgi:alpha-tubulin suppressor-like RCC1 family protein